MKHVVHNWVNLNTINSKMGQTNLDLLNSNESIFFRSMRPKILRLPPKAYTDWMMRKGHSETWEVTSLGRACMMVRVVMSSATLVPAPASPSQLYCSSRPHTKDHCLPSLSLLAKKVSSHSSTVHTLPYNRTSKIIYTLQQGWKSLLHSKLSILEFLSNSFIKTGWIKSFNCHRSKMFIAQ
jgi:hypothetical protein